MAESTALRYTDAQSRRDHVAELVVARGVLTPGQLAEQLRVSERTVRRDLRLLADTGAIRLTHGSAYAPETMRSPVDFPQRSIANPERKQAIGVRASAEVRAGETIGIDSGTTALELACALPDLPDLTVATHSLAAVNALRARTRTSLIVLGGVYQDSTMSTTGPQTRQAIGRLRIGTLFLSATSFDATGVFCATPFDAETKQALIEVSRRVVLIADSTKAFGVAPALVCPLETVDLLITDDGLADPPAGLSTVRVPG
jgi:DeoR/GlpR family transcriptional regulator of sugar metabolism